MADRHSTDPIGPGELSAPFRISRRQLRCSLPEDREAWLLRALRAGFDAVHHEGGHDGRRTLH